MNLVIVSGKAYDWRDDPPACYRHELLDQIIDHYWVPISRKNTNLIQKFYSLASTWIEETSFLSSAKEMAMHPAYQQIIGMGKDVIPLILWQLEKNPNHWFWALKAITGEDPVKPEDRGKVGKMAEAWLKWGKEHGYKW